MVYTCERCGYKTSVLCNLKTHLKRKNPCESLLCDIETAILYNEYFNKDKKYKCEYCDKCYTHAPAKSMHKKTCSKRIEIEIVKKQNEDKLEELQKQIDELKQKSTMTTTMTTTTTNIENQTNNNTNITINAFGKENIDYLVNNPKYKQMMLSCMNTKEQGIMQLIKYIHFNPEHPENQNLRKPNKKDECMKSYDGQKWNLIMAKDGLLTVLIKIESEFYKFLELMEDDGERVKDPIMNRFMRTVGHALNFDFSPFKYADTCNLTEKELEKMKKNLHTLFYFFINERTKEQLNPFLAS